MQRATAAAEYRPRRIELLLVAETPPNELERYFYFEDVTQHDHLFRYVTRHLLGEEPSRSSKARQLKALTQQGVFLIDLKEDPYDERAFDECVDGLVDRCRALSPGKIVLIKSNVYDLAYPELRAAGLPVVPIKVYFPSTGRQKQFDEKFPEAVRYEDSE